MIYSQMKLPAYLLLEGIYSIASDAHIARVGSYRLSKVENVLKTRLQAEAAQ
jgi:hypothetical protein